MQFTDFSTGSPATGSSSNHFQLQYCKTPDQNALWARQTCKIVWHPHLPAMRSSRRNSAAGVPPQNRSRAVRQAEYDALSASSKSAFHYTDDPSALLTFVSTLHRACGHTAMLTRHLALCS